MLIPSQIFTGCIPFDDLRHDYAIVMKVMEGARPQRTVAAGALGLSNAIWAWMTKAWSPSPRQRPTLIEIAVLSEHMMPDITPWSEAHIPSECDCPQLSDYFINILWCRK